MWNIITNYPLHPSPYFSALERAFAAQDIECRFFAELDEALSSSGIVNLHRLQRLYYVRGRPDTQRLEHSLDLIRQAKCKGMIIAWTVHNLLPLSSGARITLDHHCTRSVLALSDVVICHTQADARYIRQLAPDVEVQVCGSAGLWMPEAVDEPHLTPLVQAMASVEQAFLAFGHITAYKDLVRLSKAFFDATSKARLFIAGEARDHALLSALRDLEKASAGRLVLWPERVDPAQAHRLYRKCAVAVCGYVTSGRYAYFRDVLHPSSVTTARGFNIPVITPDTASTRELATGIPALLYDAPQESLDIEGAMHLAEQRFVANAFQPRTVQDDWIGIARAYKSIGHVHDIR